MPFYEYKCLNCGEKFEFLQSIDDPPCPCPECASDNVKRLISLCSGQVDMSAKEMYHTKIQPEAESIARRIKEGDEQAAADIFGEGKMFNDE